MRGATYGLKALSQPSGIFSTPVDCQGDEGSGEFRKDGLLRCAFGGRAPDQFPLPRRPMNVEAAKEFRSSHQLFPPRRPEERRRHDRSYRSPSFKSELERDHLKILEERRTWRRASLGFGDCTCGRCKYLFEHVETVGPGRRLPLWKRCFVLRLKEKLEKLWLCPTVWNTDRELPSAVLCE
jgi:hypothetical protein